MVLLKMKVNLKIRRKLWLSCRPWQQGMAITICMAQTEWPFILFFFAFRYMFDKEGAAQINPALQDALFMMVVANSCVNPIIYGRYTKKTLGKFVCPCSLVGIRGRASPALVSQQEDEANHRQRTSDLIAVTSVIWRMYGTSRSNRLSRAHNSNRGIIYSTGSAPTTHRQRAHHLHPLLITRQERDIPRNRQGQPNQPSKASAYDEVREFFSIDRNDLELQVFDRDGP